MEGVGARLGRSSSRYGTTTVFTGPVRKWKKHWVPITPSPSSNHNNNNNNNSNSNSNHHNNNNNNVSNGSINGALRLFKWTPLDKDIINNIKKTKKITDNDNDNDDDDDNNDTPVKQDVDVDSLSNQPPRRKFKFVPIAVLEEQKKENEENSDDEAKVPDEDIEDGYNTKPDINDVPMEENQDSEENQAAPARQDLNELDLSLGLTSHEDEHHSD